MIEVFKAYYGAEVAGLPYIMSLSFLGVIVGAILLRWTRGFFRGLGLPLVFYGGAILFTYVVYAFRLSTILEFNLQLNKIDPTSFREVELVRLGLVELSINTILFANVGCFLLGVFLTVRGWIQRKGFVAGIGLGIFILSLLFVGFELNNKVRAQYYRHMLESFRPQVPEQPDI